MTTNINNIYKSTSTYYKISRIVGNVSFPVTPDEKNLKYRLIIKVVKFILITCFFCLFLKTVIVTTQNDQYFLIIYIEGKIYSTLVIIMTYYLLYYSYSNWKRSIKILREIHKIDCILQNIGVLINHKQQKKIIIGYLITIFAVFFTVLYYTIGAYPSNYLVAILFFGSCYLNTILTLSVAEFQIFTYLIKCRLQMINSYLSINKNTEILCRCHQLLVHVLKTVNSCFSVIILLKWMIVLISLTQDSFVIFLWFFYGYESALDDWKSEILWFCYDFADISLIIYLCTCVIYEVSCIK